MYQAPVRTIRAAKHRIVAQTVNAHSLSAALNVSRGGCMRYIDRHLWPTDGSVVSAYAVTVSGVVCRRGLQREALS